MTTEAVELEHARSLLDLRRHADAAAILRRVLADDPRHVAALQLLAVAELGLGDLAAATRTIRAALTRAPDDPYGHYLHTTILLRAVQVPAAIDAARECVRLAPQHWAGYAVLARALAVSPRDRDEAAAAADRAVTLAPDVADAHLAVAVVALAARRDRKAVEAVQRALAITPDDPKLLEALSEMHLQRGRPVAALNVAGALARGHPTAERLRQRLVKSSALLVVLPNLILSFSLILGIGLVSQRTGVDVSPDLPTSASATARLTYALLVFGGAIAVGWWILHRLTRAARAILRWRLLNPSGVIATLGAAVAATGVVLVATADRTGDADLVGGLMVASWLCFSLSVLVGVVSGWRADLRDAGVRPNSGTVRWALAVSLLNLTSIELGDRHDTPSMLARLAWAVGLFAAGLAVTGWVVRRLDRRTMLAGGLGVVVVALAGYAVLAPAWLPLTAEHGVAPQLFGLLGGWAAVVLLGVRSMLGRRGKAPHPVHPSAGPGSEGA